MNNSSQFRWGIVLIPLVAAGLLITLLLNTITPASANQLSSSRDRSTQSLTKLKWVTECVDCNKRIFDMTNQSMVLDANGYPHIAYGGDSLYYTWFDGTSWFYETVDDAAGVGGSAALALDQEGNPHISYHDRVVRALRYAYRDAEGWHVEIADDNPGDTGFFTAIVVDENNQPHITYYDVANRLLRYAYFDGSAWQIQPIDGAGVYSSLLFDSSGAPHVSYHDVDTGDLMYAYLDQTGWITETIDSVADAGSFTSLVLDDSGYPHIGYYDEVSGTLKYAFQDGNGWTLQDLEIGSNAGEYLDLELSPEGVPWMSYFEANNGDLKVGYLDGSTWVSSTIDSEGNVGGYTSLEFDDAGDLYVAYSEIFCQGDGCGVVTLKLAQLSESVWSFQNVDYSSRTGGSSTLAMDSAGLLQIGYMVSHGNIANLRYATHQEDNWLLTTLEAADQFGYTSEPAMVLDSQGIPRFSYTISVCAPDDGCTTDGVIYAEQAITGLVTATVDTGIGNGMHSSIAVNSEGYPRISYYDAGNFLLKYALLDSMGWTSEVVTITNLTTDTVISHLQLDGQGYPHIVYNHAGLRYAYQDGDGWHFDLIDPNPAVRATSIAIASTGAVQIMYQETVSSTLNYAYQDQGIWITETITGVTTDGYLSLVLDSNDVPYVAYHSTPEADLMLTHLSQSGWVHEVADSTGDVGRFASLVLGEEGAIYISYYDATNGDLRLASRVDIFEMFIPMIFKAED